MASGEQLEEYKQAIRELSDLIVLAQKPIRILDSLKWDAAVEQNFFDNKCKKLPPIDVRYYQNRNPLSFDPKEKIEEFREIDRHIRRRLGQYSGVGDIMQRMCYEYSRVVDMLVARGTPQFSEISKELYGSAQDVFHIGAPTIKDMAELVSETIAKLKDDVVGELDEKIYTSADAVKILSERLTKYFSGDRIYVELSDGIVADAAAGADRIKIHDGLKFSLREIRVFEKHEGWVHLATTLNGLDQPVCTFLSKGPPSSTVAQEGLAILTEMFTFSSSPGRVLKLTNRVNAVGMAEDGANFLDVFHYYRNMGIEDSECYQLAVRVFRGSIPDGGPFTKDLAYSKGFMSVYNYMRLAVQSGIVKQIPLLFVGKTTIEDLHVLADLQDEGIVAPPKYIPPQFKDLAAITAWMVYSLFLNRLDLKRLALDFKGFLQ